jgi:succinate dehydrogenase / fumarate reductase cytochrome b subunit
MSNFSSTFSSTLGKKLIMCLTGLFLCSFLIVHLTGNLALFKNDDGLAFNQYAHFMTTFTPIKIVSYLLYTSIIVHSAFALFITIQNKKARPVAYAQKSGNGSIWSSRNMGILGTILLVFIVSHMRNFWYEYHWGQTPYVKYETDLNTGKTVTTEITAADYTGYVSYVNNGIEITKSKNLYKEVATEFKEWYLVAFYVLAMLAMSFHLVHGFSSAFQTLGWNHSKYKPLINFIGVWVFSILIPLGFAAMPLYFFFK